MEGWRVSRNGTVVAAQDARSLQPQTKEKEKERRRETAGKAVQASGASIARP